MVNTSRSVSFRGTRASQPWTVEGAAADHGTTCVMLPPGFSEEQLLTPVRTAPVVARSRMTSTPCDVASQHVAFVSSRRAGVLSPSLTPCFDLVFPTKPSTIRLSADAERVAVVVGRAVHVLAVRGQRALATFDDISDGYTLEDVLFDAERGLWLLLSADNGVSVRIERRSLSGDLQLSRDVDGGAHCNYHLFPQPNGSPLVWGADGGDSCLMWTSLLTENDLRLWRYRRDELYLCSFAPSGDEALIMDNGVLKRVAFPDMTPIATGEFPEQDWNRLEQAAYVSPGYAVVSTSEGRLFGCELSRMRFDAELIAEGYVPTPRASERHLSTLLSLVPGPRPADLVLCGDGELLRVDARQWLPAAGG